ncbi:MAG: heme biosynthesis protein HemY [gamma proteobacterium symbiont of Bathyaustriella thionipta]|nr:heme biosynthesis protein HemY [gamma proteobacterium symbiont of Bathyaustriella thionipta]
MKGLLGLGLVLLASVALTHVLLQDNGYVLLSYGSWSVETSLALFAGLNLLLWLLLYALLRSVINLFSVPGRIHNWRQQRAQQQAQASLIQGLIEVSEGHWAVAEKTLLRHVEHSKTPLLNYLAAARAAQQLGEHERRDEYLQRAHESMPSADIAVGLTQAELQLSHQQLEQALATLMHLKSIAPRHAYVLKLLKKLYVRLQDWDALKLLLPELKKRKVLSTSQLQDLELELYTHLLNATLQPGSKDDVRSIWQSMPKSLRQRASMIHIYVPLLIQSGQQENARTLINETLRRDWDDVLCEMLMRINVSDPAVQQNIAEAWLKQQADNPVLLRLLARLSLQNKLWGKARSYLEASLGVRPDSETSLELGLLLQRMGEEQAASDCFREGLQLMARYEMPEIPAIIDHTPLAVAPPAVIPMDIPKEERQEELPEADAGPDVNESGKEPAWIREAPVGVNILFA